MLLSPPLYHRALFEPVQWYSRLAPQIKPFLRRSLTVNGRKVPRYAARGRLLKAGRDFLERNLRYYSNQCMIAELNVYLCNRGLEIVDPRLALSQKKALNFLNIGMGLAPYRGSKTAHGWEWPFGRHYTVVTRAGLTRELGFVGTYGEIQNWAAGCGRPGKPPP